MMPSATHVKISDVAHKARLTILARSSPFVHSEREHAPFGEKLTVRETVQYCGAVKPWHRQAVKLLYALLGP
jgi:hypothetical protein